ncbi:acyltransferase family protein [Porphyrobacter sp. HT-58-2]|uniref:acyltransferase family protein n=1 Tax=Porphyrobacter sp. HT-58-2 TaxID=2023229 RepID=UPI0015587838|nr:acyltransferase family protein [Porphyrobacter sp. HT-58-2]
MTFAGAPEPVRHHRPDIEGLRAVAVIAVLLFHLGIDTASGGFVGVDVFFVISGFLIGGIVVREAVAGHFRLADYLVRRVRRIVPVMVAILAVVSLAAAILLLPGELAGYSTSLGFSALFAANIHFWINRGAYAESDHEVLLHMWTLGVEGQFYLVLPLIVLGLIRLGRLGLWFGIGVLGLASATASLMLDPVTSFYMLPPRLWEFLLGVLVAIVPLPFLGMRAVREALAFTGVAMILYAVIAFDTGTPFPGWRAAIPCVGAAAIIAAGSHGTSWMGQILETAPARFIGRISYSLYLWHWPVIVLLLLGLPAGALDPALQIVAALVSLVLAVVSWKFIEEPFRRPAVAVRRLLLGSGLATIGLVGVAVVLTQTAGLPQRFSERGLSIAAGLDAPLDDLFRSGRCFIHHRSQQFDESTCLEDADGRSHVLLVGDSQAANLWPGLHDSFRGSAVSQVTAAGCRPALEYNTVSRYPFCPKLMRWALNDYMAQRPSDLLVLAARWEDSDMPALRSLLLAMREKGQAVLLVGPPAQWSQFVPRLLALSHERGQGTALAESLRALSQADLDRQMAGIAAETGADYVSLLRIQCAPQCRYFGKSGTPLIVDDSHFTREASLLYASAFEHPALVRAKE